MIAARLLTLEPPRVVRRAPPVVANTLALIAVILAGLALSTSSPGRLIAIAIAMVLAIRWPVDRLIVVMLVLFIAVDDPSSAPYNDLWTSPVQHVGDFWFNTISKSVPFIPIPIAPMLIVSMIIAARAFTGRTGPGLEVEEYPFRLPPTFGNAWFVAFAVIPVLAVWGAITGGDVQQVYYQIFGISMALALAAATARVTTPALSSLIWKIVLVTAIYRAFLAIYIYLTVARGIEGDPPLYLTSHSDSITWALALVMVISRFIERTDRLSRILAGSTVPILMIAIVVNNRRLAWVVIMGALAYVVLSASRKAHHRLLQVSGFLVPIILVYTLAGLAAPPARVFAPVQSLQSVFTGEDSSSQTRGIEDFNLVYSAKQGFPLPAGFGKPYIEAVVADDISASFPQYRYLPHNSMLGMMNLAGPIGLSLLLAPLALCVHTCHRLRKATQDPDLRTHTALVMTTWIAFLAQAWGDLGLFSPLPTATVGIACGLGLGLYSWFRHHGGLQEQLA